MFGNDELVITCIAILIALVAYHQSLVCNCFCSGPQGGFRRTLWTRPWGGGLPKGFGLGRPQFCLLTASFHAMPPNNNEASLLADLADQVKLMLDQLDQLDALDRPGEAHAPGAAPVPAECEPTG